MDNWLAGSFDWLNMTKRRGVTTAVGGTYTGDIIEPHFYMSIVECQF